MTSEDYEMKTEHYDNIGRFHWKYTEFMKFHEQQSKGELLSLLVQIYDEAYRFDQIIEEYEKCYKPKMERIQAIESPEVYNVTLANGEQYIRVRNEVSIID